jgi:hypothetical protein
MKKVTRLVKMFLVSSAFLYFTVQCLAKGFHSIYYQYFYEIMFLRNLSYILGLFAWICYCVLLYKIKDESELDNAVRLMLVLIGYACLTLILDLNWNLFLEKLDGLGISHYWK